MIALEIRQSVHTLQAQGHSVREIGRLLRLSRNTVRRVLRATPPVPAAPCPPQTLAQLRATFERARGNVAWVQQLLADEQDLNVAYSTLTRWVRQAGLRTPPPRAGEYTFAPGEEMQHDTSPHRVNIGGRLVTAQCAALVLAYSRRLCLETNFLPGRSFRDFEDLNHQALAWCREVANHKPMRVLGMSPEAAGPERQNPFTSNEL
jgi:transposase